MSNFCDIIKKLREEKGYNQETLAEELGISKSTVAMWETNKRFPSKELYEQIADLFNVDIDYLYGRTEIRKKVHYDNYGNEYRFTNMVCEGGCNYTCGNDSYNQIFVNQIEKSIVNNYRLADEIDKKIVLRTLKINDSSQEKTVDTHKTKKYIPTEEDIESLVARNGKEFTREEAIEFISALLTEDDEDE